MPSKIAPSGSSTLTFTITNPNASVGLTGIGFTDTFPSGLFISTPNGLTGACGGGTITAVAGSTSVTLAGASLAGGASCTFGVTVTAPHEDTLANSTGAVASSAGNGAPGTATLSVASRPVITKTFGAVSIGPGDVVSLTFVLTNPNTFTALVGLAFTDALPAGLIVSAPNGLTGSCGGGSITAVPGSSSIALVGATLAPGASCTFGVNVTATGTPQGLLTNSTGSVSSLQAQPGLAATADIFVGNPFQVSYFPNLNLGDSAINITNAGSSIPSSVVAQGVSILADNPPILVDVYVFSPDEQMISCCSCPVTPNGLVSLSVLNDLVSNTLTPARPTSVVVKLLATAQGSTAASPGPLRSGMAAWGTKLHPITTGPGSGGPVVITETPFTNAILSPGELSRLGTLCSFIVGNGSGFGLCRSCRLGGLGATGR